MVIIRCLKVLWRLDFVACLISVSQALNIWGIRGHVESDSWVDRIGLRVLRALLP
jgi:hypothetical protein